MHKCKHFGKCGGCSLELPYKEQVELKREAVLAEASKKGVELPPLEVVESPKQYEYRNRMDYVFSFGKAGLREKGNWKGVFEVEECHLIDNKAFELFREMAQEARKEGLESYNVENHTGFLKYFVVRSTRKNEMMISLVTSTQENEDNIRKLCTLALEKGATSANWILQDKTDTGYGKVIETHGKPFITETLLGKDFKIGPNTFFQQNKEVAEKAFELIIQHAKGARTALDLYSGTGVIASLLPTDIKVIAVENNPENEATARQQIGENVEYALSKTNDFFKTYEGNPDVTIVDPPRAGLERALPKIAAASKKIIYMSCNPKTLMQDLQALQQEFRITHAYLLDMFPQTRHCEMLVIMEKQF